MLCSSRRDRHRHDCHDPVESMEVVGIGGEQRNPVRCRHARDHQLPGGPGRTAGDLVGPQLAADPDRRGRIPARALGGRAVAVGEGGRIQPGLERNLIPPPGYHQPGSSPVGRLEQLKALEAVLVIDRASTGGEPPGQLVTAVSRHRDRVDLNHSHSSIMPTRHPLRAAGYLRARHGAPCRQIFLTLTCRQGTLTT